MRIWITGICGFLGAHLSDYLSARGHIVDGNDNGVCNSMPLKFSRAIDCRDFKGMKTLLDEFKPDVLIHCAATAHEGLSSFSPSFITKNIYEASVTTFSAAIAAGVKRIVFMSSMARYGDQAPPFHEDMQPKPVDPYGVAKVAAEDTLRILAKTHGIEHVILVPHNIIGTRQKYDDPARNVVSIMINRALRDKPLIIYGDGKQKRCFSPIADCLPSIERALTFPIDRQIINIGPDTGEMTINEMAEFIQVATAKNVELLHVADRPNEVKEAFCSSDKARSLLGYEKKQNIYECLSEMVQYIEEAGALEFRYFFPIEISEGCPSTWKDKLI